MKYLTIIEKTNAGYSAYSPDLDGCVSTGSTVEEVTVNMQEAIAFHVEGLELEGYEIPQPSSTSAYIEAMPICGAVSTGHQISFRTASFASEPPLPTTFLRSLLMFTVSL